MRLIIAILFFTLQLVPEHARAEGIAFVGCDSKLQKRVVQLISNQLIVSDREERIFDLELADIRELKGAELREAILAFDNYFGRGIEKVLRASESIQGRPFPLTLGITGNNEHVLIMGPRGEFVVMERAYKFGHCR